MIEHCDSWIEKINRAEQEGFIKRENILFALDTPNTAHKANILDTIKRTFDHFKLQHIKLEWKINKLLISPKQSNLKPCTNAE